MMRRIAFTILGWIISIALIASLAARLDFSALWDGLRQARWSLLAAAAAINIVVVAIKTARWQLFVRHHGGTTFGETFKATMIGLAGNNVLPARGGDWYRIYLLGKWTAASKAVLASVTGIEKLFDGLAVILLFGILSLSTSFPEWVQRGTLIVSTVIVISLVICVLLLLHHRRTVGGGAQEMGRIALFAKKLGSGMSVLTDTKLLLGTLFVSVMMYVVQVGTIWCCQLAFHQHLDISVPLLVLIAVNLAIVVPSAPSGIGPFEVAAVLAYTWLGVGKETALGIALMYHAVQFFPVTITGAVLYFTMGGLSPRTSGHKPKDMRQGAFAQGPEAMQRGAGRE